MAFSINGRIYHSSLGLALIVLGPVGRRQLRQGLGSHDIFTIFGYLDILLSQDSALKYRTFSDN